MIRLEANTSSIDADQTALLIMDYQNRIVADYGAGDPELTKRAASVLDAARGAGIAVIHVVVRFRPGHPEVANRGIFKAIKEAGAMVEGSEGVEIHPDVAPHSSDIVVTKKRIGAFTGSDLDVVLRSLGSQHLILLGIATSGVVLSTARAAADLDFELTVVADCCADQDEEVHRVLTQKVFARSSTITTAADLIAELG
jgi:nicotinamidase-related amidase